MATVETTRPLISVRRADSSVTLPREGRRVTLDLGAYLVAGDLPFEVRITRPAELPYRSPISATILRPDSAGGDVTVPSELLNNFGGLPKFASIRLRDEAGDACLRPHRPVLWVFRDRTCATRRAGRISVPDGVPPV
jgi:hypothetical protein